ncbi:MAG: VIT1/CCC1 transporter family protein [Acidobacteriota bacterium]
MVFGANDGLITTFAVVAGVAGGHLSATATHVFGVANIPADGLSMAVGKYLSIRSEEGSVKQALVARFVSHG